jgi:hypothetical protein
MQPHITFRLLSSFSRLARATTDHVDAMLPNWPSNPQRDKYPCTARLSCVCQHQHPASNLHPITRPSHWNLSFCHYEALYSSISHNNWSCRPLQALEDDRKLNSNYIITRHSGIGVSYVFPFEIKSNDPSVETKIDSSALPCPETFRPSYLANT